MPLTAIVRWRPGRYARDSLLTFFWLGARAVAQAVLVLLLARWLRAEGYGQFVATLAVVSFFTPLAGLGLHGVLLRDIARTPESGPQLLAQALTLWWRSALVCSLVAAALAGAVLPESLPWWTIAALAFGEVFSSSGVELLARVEQAHHRLGRFAALLFALIAGRLLALLLYAAYAHPGVAGWMLAYAVASLTMLGGALAWARPVRARGPIPWLNLAREGWPFAVGALSFRLQGEFNKPVLAHIGFAEAGYFGIAQRVVDLASLPLIALQEALWPRVYAAENPRRRLAVVGAVLLAMALLGGLGILLAAPWLPLLLGSGYEATAQLLGQLAFLPFLQVMRNLGIASMVACGHAQLLTRIYLMSMLGGTVATSLLIWHLELVGAVIAAYATEVVAIIVQWGLSTRRGINERYRQNV